MNEEFRTTNPNEVRALALSFNSGIKCDEFIERCTQQPTFESIGIVASQGNRFGMKQKTIGFSTNSPHPLSA